MSMSDLTEVTIIHTLHDKFEVRYGRHEIDLALCHDYLNIGMTHEEIEEIKTATTERVARILYDIWTLFDKQL